MKKEFDIEDEWLPMEIHPETPIEGMPVAEMFPTSSIEKMYANLRETGKHYGIDFKGNALLSNSHFALAAGEYAKEKGKFEAFHERVFHAYFNEEKDIGDFGVLSSIAEGLGLDKEEMVQRLQTGFYSDVLNTVKDTAQHYDITSTPTFIIDNQISIVGAQPIEAFRKALLDIEKQQ